MTSNPPGGSGKGLRISKYAPKPTDTLVDLTENMALDAVSKNTAVQDSVPKMDHNTRQPMQQSGSFFCGICGKDYTDNRSEFFTMHLKQCKLSTSTNANFVGKYDQNTGQLNNATSEVSAKTSAFGNVTKTATSTATMPELPANSDAVERKDISRKWVGARTITSLGSTSTPTPAPKASPSHIMVDSRFAARSPRNVVSSPSGMMASRFAQPSVIEASPKSVVKRFQMPTFPADEYKAVAELRHTAEEMKSLHTHMNEPIPPVQKDKEEQERKLLKEKTKIDTYREASKNAALTGSASITSNSPVALASVKKSKGSLHTPLIASKEGSGQDSKDLFGGGPRSSRTVNPIAATTSTTGAENSLGNTPAPANIGSAHDLILFSKTAVDRKEDFTNQFNTMLQEKGLPHSKSNSATPSPRAKTSKDTSNKTSSSSNTDTPSKSPESSQPTVAPSVSFPSDRPKATTDSPVDANTPHVASGNPFAWADSPTWRSRAATPMRTSPASDTDETTSSPVVFDAGRHITKSGGGRAAVEDRASASDVESDVSEEGGVPVGS
ncbi:hypothetical protein PMIN04_000714 [Paraphaeosphaeria minitans]